MTNKVELGALVRNNDSPKDGLYSDRESFALASLGLYIQPFDNRSVRLLVSYSTSLFSVVHAAGSFQCCLLARSCRLPTCSYR